MSIQIIVAQRGWVLVGDFEREGDHLVAPDARVVRVWGTTRGLAQLANEGPTDKTVLEDSARGRIHVLGVVLSFDCHAEAWAKISKKR